MKAKKIPLRTCIACNTKKEKKELVRIIKDENDRGKIDLTGKANGKGAYVCMNTKCFKIAAKKKLFKKKIGVSFEEEEIGEILKILENIEKK